MDGRKGKVVCHLRKSDNKESDVVTRILSGFAYICRLPSAAHHCKELAYRRTSATLSCLSVEWWVQSLQEKQHETNKQILTQRQSIDWL